MTSSLQSIALGAWSETRELMVEVAKEIKRRHGSKIHLYCANEDTRDHYLANNDDGLFDSIVVTPTLIDFANEKIEDIEQEFFVARKNEKYLGSTLNKFAVSNRHVGRGYALAGFYHPRSRASEAITYEQMVHSFNRLILFWQKEIVEKKISLVVHCGNVAASIAEAESIPFRQFSIARVANRVHWSWNTYHENPRILARYLQNKENDFDGVEAVTKPYHSHLAHRNVYEQKMSLRGTIHDISLQIAYHIYWRLKKLEKGKSYFLSSEISYLYRRWRDWNKVQKLSTTTLENLDSKKWVYYPLHIEPETGFHGISPEYFYQLSLIAAVSRDLPAGVRLGVKELYAAVGRRPDNFYDQINDLKNVFLIDPKEHGFDCAQKCDAVVTICGTGGFEAAMFGKPVVTFGRHNMYNALPHVHAITDEVELPSVLEKCLCEKHDTDEAIQDCRRLLHAIEAETFDMGEYDFINLNSFNTQSVVDACDFLEKSLGDDVG